jgi:hypothetical protein
MKRPGKSEKWAFTYITLGPMGKLDGWEAMKGGVGLAARVAAHDRFVGASVTCEAVASEVPQPRHHAASQQNKLWSAK